MTELTGNKDIEYIGFDFSKYVDANGELNWKVQRKYFEFFNKWIFNLKTNNNTKPPIPNFDDIFLKWKNR